MTLDGIVQFLRRKFGRDYYMTFPSGSRARILSARTIRRCNSFPPYVPLALDPSMPRGVAELRNPDGTVAATITGIDE